ncbi:MAG TPA: hypothetical protein PLZ29_08715 [Spirochaetota bacterium]|nr:hypothetical protein [Spirochaetota bacterium]
MPAMGNSFKNRIVLCHPEGALATEESILGTTSTIQHINRC